MDTRYKLGVGANKKYFHDIAHDLADIRYNIGQLNTLLATMLRFGVLRA